MLWYAGAGVLLALVLGGTMLWAHRSFEELADQLTRSERMAARVLDLQGAILGELEAGHRYLVTGDPDHELQFIRRGIEAHDVGGRIMASVADAPEVAAALVPVQQYLAIAEAALARAHRLAELGRMAEAQEGVARTSEHTEALVAALEQQDSARAARHEALTARLAQQVPNRAFQVLFGVFVAFGLSMAAATGVVGQVVTATHRLTDHAARLQDGDLDVRTEVKLLPQEIRVLGEALNDAGRSLEQLARKEQALVQAEKLSAVGLLVSGVAHELNNPLATILLTSEDLTQRQEPGELEAGQLKEELATIHAHALRARSIVRQLLATVREDRHPRERVRLAEVIARARPALDDRAEKAGARLDWRLESEDLVAMGGMLALETVLTNLVTNALEALEGAGWGGTVVVRASSAAGQVKLTVEDDGPGIGPEIRSRIFDPFFTTRSEDKGVGLGLSVARGLVRSMGGSLTHEDVPGGEGGARFVVSFPTGERELPGPPGEGEPKPEVTPPRPGPVSTLGPARRILVVDDEDALRAVLRRVFERHGWSVEEARDGSEALARVQARREGNGFDVILTDLKMPVMSGMELVDRLLSSDPDLRERVVVMTGDNVAAGPAEFLERTSLPVVDKPFEVARVVEVVDGVAAAAERET